MSQDPKQAADSRRRATVVALVAAAVLAVVTLVSGVVDGADDGAPDTGAKAGGAVVATLEAAPKDAPGRCMAPDATALQRLAEVAFSGTAVGVTGTDAVLEVETAYLGGLAVGDRVELRLPIDREPAVDLEQGGRYLIAGADGAVIGCGFSGLDEPRLAAMYDRAFAQ